MKPNRISHNKIKFYKIDAALREQKRNEWNAPVFWPMLIILAVFVLGVLPALKGYRRRKRGMGVGV